jgi:hypothetical protein
MKKNNIMHLLKEKNVAVLVTGIILTLGIIAYLNLSINATPMTTNKDVIKLKDNIDFKIAFTENNEMKLFATTENTVLSLFPTNGAAAPEENSMLLGFTEAEMMKSENLITGIGSELQNFFGINTIVSGTLKKTSSFVDDTHFLSKKQFAQLQGYENIIILQFTPSKEPKLFYLLDEKDPFVEKIPEAILENYHTYDGYYPVILGFDEASMMLAEGLITGKGDTLENFFGKDAVIVGILPPTGTVQDMMHFVPKNYFTQEAKA